MRKVSEVFEDSLLAPCGALVPSWLEFAAAQCGQRGFCHM